LCKQYLQEKREQRTFLVLEFSNSLPRFDTCFAGKVICDLTYLFEMKKIKLVALDLDGTTLNNDHALTDQTINTLQKLSIRGIIICIATGRSMDRRLMEYIQALGQRGCCNCLRC
jgi:hypothetical protein